MGGEEAESRSTDPRATQDCCGASIVEAARPERGRSAFHRFLSFTLRTLTSI
jgi:hypothetical protein